MLVRGPANYNATFRVVAQGVNPNAKRHMGALASFLRKSKIRIVGVPGMGTSNYHGLGLPCHDYMCKLDSFNNWPFQHQVTDLPQIFHYSYYKKLYSICLLETKITQDVQQIYKIGV